MTDKPTPAGDEEAGETRRSKPRRGQRVRRRLVNTAALPALFTILNGLAGFASIHFATKNALGEADLWNLAAAAWLIFAAMVFDMLDGRVARITRRTSDFGGQLDSLCDVISFGAAPAMLMVRTVTMALRGQVERMDVLSGALTIERAIWCVAGVYLACAALRLARFNVENEPAESAHMDFCGLPCPGAAAAVAALVLLFAHLAPMQKGWQSSAWILMTVSITLPIVTLLTAMLMVSRLRYTHVVNQYIRSDKPFGFLVKLVLLLLAAFLNFAVTMAVLAVAYALSGLVAAIWRRAKPKRKAEAPSA